MEIGHVTSKGQIVIPARLRRRYGIETGTKICFIERDQEILLQPITEESIRQMRGMLKSRGSAAKELLRERSRDRKREDGRVG